MQRRHAALAVALLATARDSFAQRRRVAAAAGAAGSTYGRRSDVVDAAQAIAQLHALEPGWVESVLAQARFIPQVAQLMMPPASPSARNWGAYRARFVEARRIDAGRAWWSQHEPWLREAEQRWGVPADIVVGIVGVETYYGRITGNFRVLDALATLTFDFPGGRSDRSAFFRTELGQFLRLAQRESWDPITVKGSFAGAMGLPQFMPSSVLNFGVDLDQDGRVDLTGSGADVVGSVAHFLSEHGWQRDMPTHYPVRPPSAILDRALLLVPDIVPSFSAAQMVERGALLDEPAMQHAGSLALVQLHNGDAAPSYVAGTQNFYALTRYNASSYYALAVIELGRAVVASRL